MAKTQRAMLGLACPVCKQLNYIITKNKTNVPDKLTLKKFCKWCRKATEHKETTKFK